MPDSQATELLRVVAPHFAADVVDDEWGLVIRAEPDLAWAVGKHIMELRRHCLRVGWKVVPAVPGPPPAR